MLTHRITYKEQNVVGIRTQIDILFGNFSINGSHFTMNCKRYDALIWHPFQVHEMKKICDVFAIKVLEVCYSNSNVEQRAKIGISNFFQTIIHSF